MKARLRLENRRYIGNKYKLLDWIFELIFEHCKGSIFFDPFAGTGVVSERASYLFKKVILNDFLFSNEVIYKAVFNRDKIKISTINKYVNSFNNLKGDEIPTNYFSINYGNKFFDLTTSKIIGYIREEIENGKEEMSNTEYHLLLASLIYSVDKVANTVGHYDAYIKKEIRNHKFEYLLLDRNKSKANFEIYRKDANELARRINSDIVYLDPPYNSRQYSRFYHLLENLTKWEKPLLEGVAMKPPTENVSEYCKSSAKQAFSDLITNLNSKYIVLSYNNTYNPKSNSSKNKITIDDIQKILNSKGPTKIFNTSYKHFNSGNTNFTNHQEFLFICKVNNE